jgi:anti-sigma factor RsiW
MCPEPQILSLYFDGELPSPWREKMEAHLGSCASCAGRLDRYRLLSRSMAETAGIVPAAAGERIRWNAPNRAAPRPARLPADRTRPEAGRFWRRSVSVPLPAVAAAAAVVLALTLLFTLKPEPAQDTVASGMGLAMEGIPAADINGILQYLGSEDSSDIVIIRLPESTSFTSLGEPALMKAADYSRRNGSR